MPDTITVTREQLREPLVRAIAKLDGFDHPGTAPGDWWDRRCAPVLDAISAVLAAAPSPEPLHRLASALYTSGYGAAWPSEPGRDEVMTAAAAIIAALAESRP